MATVQDVRKVAREVVEARIAGKRSITIGNVTFDLTEAGYCNRFVREVHEAAMGLHEFDWQWASQYAIWTDYKLRRAGLEVSDPEQVDIVCFNKGKSENATPGHIGIYLGGGLVAENTSSGRRGNPRAAGTKISTLDEIGRSRAMFFATLPMAMEKPLTVSVNGVQKDVKAWIDKGISYAPVKQLVEAMDGSVLYASDANELVITK